MIKYHKENLKIFKENLKIFLVDDRTGNRLVSCNIHICWCICICVLDDNKYCNTNWSSSNCNNCINGDRLLCGDIVHGLMTCKTKI